MTVFDKIKPEMFIEDELRDDGNSERRKAILLFVLNDEDTVEGTIDYLKHVLAAPGSDADALSLGTLEGGQAIHCFGDFMEDQDALIFVRFIATLYVKTAPDALRLDLVWLKDVLERYVLAQMIIHGIDPGDL